LVSVELPLTSIVRWPLLRISPTMSGCPVAERFAVSEPTVKSAGGAPPGPIERYTRTPTRWRSVR
jgi:hypothetical protein